MQAVPTSGPEVLESTSSTYFRGLVYKQYPLRGLKSIKSTYFGRFGVLGNFFQTQGSFRAAEAVSEALMRQQPSNTNSNNNNNNSDDDTLDFEVTREKKV